MFKHMRKKMLKLNDKIQILRHVIKLKKSLSIKTKNFKLKVQAISEHVEREAIEKYPPQYVTKIKVTIKNISEHSLSLSYLDFWIVNMSDEKLKYYPYADGLGHVLNKNETYCAYFYYVGKIEEFKSLEYQYT